MNVTRVATENIEAVWPKIQGLMARALTSLHGEYDEKDVFNRLVSGATQLWLVYDDELKLRIICTTGIEIWPTAKWLRINLLAGDHFQDFYWAFDQLELWAKEQGCSKIIAAVRPGLRKRLVSNKGFSLAYETVIREIL